MRSRFWLGLILSFGLLTLGSCGGLLMASGLNRASLAELQGSGPAWTPPPVTPTPAVSAEVNSSGGAEVYRAAFAPGAEVRNITGSRVNIRSTAGYLAKPGNDVIAQVAPGERVEILGPSAEADGLIWWQIAYPAPDGRTVEGWVAEATASGVTILGE